MGLTKDTDVAFYYNDFICIKITIFRSCKEHMNYFNSDFF